MKKTSFFFIFCIGVLLGSCKKNADIPIAEPSSKLKGDKEFKKCRITKVVTSDLLQFSQTWLFEYNEKGDPVKVMPTVVLFTYSVFRYDKKGRLTDYINPAMFGGFQRWSRYQYDNNNRIVQDTTYVLGFVTDDPSSDFFPARRVHTYEYDAQDRIKRVTAVYPSGSLPPIITDYTYDAAGNLELPGVVYDNKINIRRTNRIWMFIDRDYSVNNAQPVEAYNSYGLPTTFGPNYIGFPGMSKPQHVEYDCKGDPVN